LGLLAKEEFIALVSILKIEKDSAATQIYGYPQSRCRNNALLWNAVATGLILITQVLDGPTLSALAAAPDIGQTLFSWMISSNKGSGKIACPTA